MKLTLRPYQAAAVDAMCDALARREHPLVKLPTGSGKSLVLASVVQRLRWPTLVLSHVKELLEQDARTLRRVAPEMSMSYYSAGLREKRGGAQVVFGSVQTVYRSPQALGKRSLVLIDEAHLCPRDADAMYAQVFTHFGVALRGGFTATDTRMDSGKLTEGHDAWFTSLVYEEPVGRLISQGFLVPLVGVLTEHQADLSGVGTRAGDFIAEQAEQAVTQSLSLEEAVQEAVKLASKRRHWLIFAAGVDHAKRVLSVLRAAGIESDMVLGDTPDDKRDAIVDKFREGDLRALVNVGVLTTGFDAPQTDCIISFRPTKSPVLWQQVLGRGMRLAEGKDNCLLLDFVGNLERLGGAGCVVEIRDNRTEMTVNRAPSKRRAPRKEELEFEGVSLADPMKSGASFECRVERLRLFEVPSKRFPGKKLVIASYDLEDELGRSVQARSFVNVEYAGGARFHAVKWFARRGVPPEQVPKSAGIALALAKVLPTPTEVRAYWDSRLKCYLVMEERFAQPEAEVV